MQFAKREFRRALNHWTPLTVSLGFFAAAFGILSLYLFTDAIGRIDLFLSALDAKSAIAVWLVLVVMVILTCLLFFTIITIMFGQIVSMFFDKAPGEQGRASRWLVTPYICCGIAFLASLFSGLLGWQLYAPALLTALAAYGLLFFGPFRATVNSATSSFPRKLRITFIAFLGAIVVVGAIISVILPTILVADTYSGEDTLQASWLISFIVIITMLLSLMPVIVFYSVGGAVLRRVLFGLCVLPIPVMSFLLITPGAAAGISYMAAGKLDIRQTLAARFLLEQEIQLSDLDNRQWRTRLSSTKRIEVSAFQLFSFGDVLLLCPVDLLRLSRHDLPKYTPYCISTRASKVTRKPLRFAPQVRLTKDEELMRRWLLAVSLTSRLACLHSTGRHLLLRDTPRSHISLIEFKPPQTDSSETL